MEVKSTVDEAVGVYREVTGFWNNFSNFFKPKAKQSTPKPVAKKKEKFVAVDETQVKVDIVKNLTEFFRLQEQLAAHIREEEEKSLTVYDPDQNHMEAALKRVMAQQQARLKQEATKRQEAWLRKEEERNLQAKLAAVVVTFIFLLYLWMWFVFVSHWGKK